METKRLKVVDHAHVVRVEVDRAGKAAGVTYLKGGETYFQPASVVILAGHVYENVRLLLLSKSTAYPDGLSNNHGQVGRHYMSHNQWGQVNALFPRNIGHWYGLPAQGMAVDNFADDVFDHAGFDFIGGVNMYVYPDRRPISAAGMSTFGRAPSWGSGWKAFVAENADRTNLAYLQKTTLPYEDNYLDLDPTVTDPLGQPVVRITADYKDNERKIHAFAQEKMTQWYMEAGAIAVEKLGINTMGPSTHAYGGTRMGNNPETNVVDRWGFSHECPNLGIVGAGVMGTSGSRNPTLTLQALAWRTADHLAKNWKSIVG
jgi:gluconate 2-dehydrogenase alpha chain